MSQIIGFATEFYTLWNYHTENVYTTINNQHFLAGVKHIYSYVKNISKDLDKVTSIYPNLKIDEELRGKTNSWERTEKIDYPPHIFPFGKLEGRDIASCDDVWQLTRTYDNDLNPRRRVIARNRLIALGEIVRCDWMDSDYVALSNYEDYKGIPSRVSFEKEIAKRVAIGQKVNTTLTDGSEDIVYFDIPRKYCKKAKYDEIVAKRIKDAMREKSAFLHKNGEKVTLEIKKIAQTGYDSNYGYVFVITYESTDGNIYIYKGANPIDIQPDEIVRVTATIKHNEYNGFKQTLIQRVKIVDKLEPIS